MYKSILYIAPLVFCILCMSTNQSWSAGCPTIEGKDVEKDKRSVKTGKISKPLVPDVIKKDYYEAHNGHICCACISNSKQNHNVMATYNDTKSWKIEQSAKKNQRRCGGGLINTACRVANHVSHSADKAMRECYDYCRNILLAKRDEGERKYFDKAVLGFYEGKANKKYHYISKIVYGSRSQGQCPVDKLPVNYHCNGTDIKQGNNRNNGGKFKQCWPLGISAEQHFSSLKKVEIISGTEDKFGYNIRKDDPRNANVEEYKKVY